MILSVAAIVVAYLYLAAIAHRVGHNGKHGRVWSPPRPTRLRSRGAHARPRAPQTPDIEPAQTGLAVAA